MPTTKKTYTLNKMKQLVDLNGDTTNFDLTFTATTKDGSNFDAIVVDQTTLDSNPSLEYKKADGTLSGNIISDKGVYQNYFLVLKADKPCECDITIDMKEITEKIQEPTQQSNHHLIPRQQNMLLPKKSYKWILILVLVLGAIVLYWYLSSKNSTTDSKPELIPNSPASSMSRSISSSISQSDVSSSGSQEFGGSPYNFGSRKLNEGLLTRLNNLPIH